ncbi:hypothetical protein [Spiroplasma endosymbiont of Virgichneumon dumeticola]|uniref:hypothetical protein n=1 Tax=Spiroplasma endosymbiont of Virgichneumon dumeticola TaxID=3139323 RepID=UPI0035C8B4A7
MNSFNFIVSSTSTCGEKSDNLFNSFFKIVNSLDFNIDNNFLAIFGLKVEYGWSSSSSLTFSLSKTAFNPVSLL